MDAVLRQEIGVVGMEHGAIHDADAEIGRTSAARVEIEIDGADPPVRVVADRIGRKKIVTLAGHDHVGIAVEPQLARPAGFTRRQRRDHGPLGRLGLLTAEAATHAPHLAGNERIRDSENARHDVLHLARMLGAGIDQHVAVLARHRERDLAFEIKMLLAADADGSTAVMRRAGDHRRCISTDERIIGQHHFPGRPALFDRDVGGLGIDFDATAQHRASRRVAGRRGDRKNRLAVKNHFGLRKRRLVGAGGRNIVLAWDIGRGDDGNNAGKLPHSVKIDGTDTATRNGSTADSDMERSDGLRNIVDIFCRALHVFGAAVVLQRLVDMAQRYVQRVKVTRRHRQPSGDRRYG